MVDCEKPPAFILSMNLPENFKMSEKNTASDIQSLDKDCYAKLIKSIHDKIVSNCGAGNFHASAKSSDNPFRLVDPFTGGPGVEQEASP